MASENGASTPAERVAAYVHALKVELARYRAKGNDARARAVVDELKAHGVDAPHEKATSEAPETASRR